MNETTERKRPYFIRWTGPETAEVQGSTHIRLVNHVKPHCPCRGFQSKQRKALREGKPLDNVTCCHIDCAISEALFGQEPPKVGVVDRPVDDLSDYDPFSPEFCAEMDAWHAENDHQLNREALDATAGVA